MIAGLLLAAGGARRFGSQKLLAPLDGEPLVRHSARVLESLVDKLFVVVGHERDAVRQALAGMHAAIVVNHEWGAGLSTSLRAGVTALPMEAEAVVVALGDQPQVDAALVRQLIAEWRESRRDIVAPLYDGVRGHPILFSRNTFPELRAVEGDAGARAVIERDHHRVAFIEWEGAVPKDVDTPDDLRNLSSRL
jgi:molybdenum cofactor cytidylyltransferase